jgi:anti-sigma B factor antagonist
MLDWKTDRLGPGGDILVFHISGRLDTLQCDYFFSVLENHIRRERRKLIIDCHDLEFISSMGLGMLLRVHSRMKQQGGDVRLAGVRGTVADVLHLVALDRVLQMYPCVDDAVAAFGS